MDDREHNLPKWAQISISAMRENLRTINERHARETEQIKTKLAILERKNSALQELLTCAARGEHTTAAAVIDIIEGYGLTLTKD